MQYDLAEFALKMVAPNNKLIYDDKGIPSVMVYVPKFKMSDVIDGAGDSTHPAFIINGKEVPGIWISKQRPRVLPAWTGSNCKYYLGHRQRIL